MRTTRVRPLTSVVGTGSRRPSTAESRSVCLGRRCSPFGRIATNSRAFRVPLSGERASVIVSQWLALLQVVVVAPGESFWSIFVEQVKRAQVLGPLVTDAALAALAIESGATLCSTDRDFLRLEGLKLVDPTR